MADKIAKRGVSIFIDGKEIKNSVGSIVSEMKKLEAQQKKMIVGSDEYVAHGKKIEYLKSLHREHIANQKKIAAEYGNMEKAADKAAKSSETSISKMANGFNKYFAMFTAALAALTGFTLGLKKFMDMRNELEQSSANLKAITGLDDQSVEWLRKYAKELSTTTTEAGVRITASSKEIMDGFTVIGSKRPELLKNKEAMADVTKQALTLAATGVPVETAFDVVTASMNQFNLEGKDASRIINAIAAGSLEGSAEADSLAGSLKNVGTVANDSNMSLEDTVAMLEVMASKQLVGEEAGTKLRGALLKLKDAGVGYVSGQFNVRDALVEVNQQLDSKAGALQRDALLQKIFGAENITAGTILLQNVDAYDKLRVAVTGTDTAMRQAKIQTATVTAQLAQAQNKFNELGMELVKDLNPALLKATNFGNTFMRMLMQMPQFLKENKVGIAFLVTGLTAYLIALNASNIATKSKLAWSALEKVADYLKIASLRIRIALTGEATIAELRLVAAQKAMNASMMLNIYAATAVAIAAITYAVYKLATQTTAAEKAWKNFNKESETQVQTANQLFEALKKTAAGTAERKTLIDKINSVYGEYLSNQLTEKSNLNDITIAQGQVNQALREKIAIQTKEQAKAEVTKDAVDTQVEAFESLRKRLVKIKGEDMSSVIMENIKSIFDTNQSDLTKAHKLASAYLSQQAGSKLKFVDYQNLRDYTSSLRNMVKDLAEIDAKFKMFEGRSPLTIYDPGRSTSTKGNSLKNTVTTTASDQKKEQKDAYSEQERMLEDHAKRRQILIQDMFANMVIGEELYTSLSENNTLMSLEEKLRLQKKFGKDTADTELQISSEMLKQQKKSSKEFADNLVKNAPKNKVNNDISDEEMNRYLKFLDIKKEYGLNELDNFKSQKDLELAIVQEYLDKRLITEQDAANVRAVLASKEFELNTRNAKATAQEIANIAGNLSSALQGFQAAEEQKIETKYQKEIKAAQKAGKDTTSIEERKNRELAALRAKNADAMFAVQVAGIVASTAAAAIDAYANAVKIPGAGLILAPIAAAAAVAYGGSQIVQANAAREQAKEGYYDGGFTGGDDPRKVMGVVHGKEFVSNHTATANPNLLPMYNLIDEAQKNGTAGSLTKKDLAKALNISYSYDAPIRTRTAVGVFNPNAPDNPIYAAMMARQAEVIDKLNKRLDEPIEAYSVISGRQGSYEQNKRYEKLINNASR